MSHVLAKYGARVGRNVRFNAPLTLHNAAHTDGYYHNLTIGDRCYFGRELFLDLQAKVTVEDFVTISHRVTILTHTDAGDSPLAETAIPQSEAPVTIRRGAYVGANATILQGVELGECSVVGAGALVTKDVLPFTVVVGVPARPLKTIDPLSVGMDSAVVESCPGYTENAQSIR